MNEKNDNTQQSAARNRPASGAGFEGPTEPFEKVFPGALQRTNADH
jgi:hypothetical protein